MSVTRLSRRRLVRGFFVLGAGVAVGGALSRTAPTAHAATTAPPRRGSKPECVADLAAAAA